MREPVTITAPEEVAAEAADRFREALGAAAEAGAPLVVAYLARTRHVDSSGLGALVRAQRLASRRGGRVVVVNARPEMVELFRITELDRVIEVRGGDDGLAGRAAPLVPPKPTLSDGEAFPPAS